MLDIWKRPQVLLNALTLAPMSFSYNPQKMNAKPPTKLHPRLKGPYLVDNVQGDKYSCQNLVTDEIEDYHVTRLREVCYDERYYVC